MRLFRFLFLCRTRDLIEIDQGRIATRGITMLTQQATTRKPARNSPRPSHPLKFFEIIRNILVHRPLIFHLLKNLFGDLKDRRRIQTLKNVGFSIYRTSHFVRRFRFFASSMLESPVTLIPFLSIELMRADFVVAMKKIFAHSLSCLRIFSQKRSFWRFFEPRTKGQVLAIIFDIAVSAFIAPPNHQTICPPAAQVALLVFDEKVLRIISISVQMQNVYPSKNFRSSGTSSLICSRRKERR